MESNVLCQLYSITKYFLTHRLHNKHVPTYFVILCIRAVIVMVATKGKAALWNCVILTMTTATGKDSKAKAAKKAVLQGAKSHSARKVRTSVSFHRPKTLRLPREPRYPRKSIPHAPRMDQFRTIVSYVSLSFSLGALYTKVIIGH